MTELVRCPVCLRVPHFSSGVVKDEFEVHHKCLVESVRLRAEKAPYWMSERRAASEWNKIAKSIKRMVTA